MSGIIWLASYPKSGNTWLRVFLANVRSGSSVAVDINVLNTAHFGARELFDRTIGWETSDLTLTEIESLRAETQQALAQPAPLIKTHEAFTDPADGRRRFSLSATRCALYVIRNPLDVVVSLNHYSGDSIEAAIGFMNEPRASLNFPPNGSQLPQLLCDWSTHVKSWVDAPGLSVSVLRYEDMLAAPEKTFAHACRCAGLPCEPERVAQAVAHSRFDTLQQQEKQKGFSERMTNRAFFREGRSGAWREKLHPGQIAAIVEHHAEVMRRFGYLNPDGSLPE